MKKINLAILDDDYLIVTLLKSFFSQNDLIDVIFDTTDGYQLYKYLEKEESIKPDILLLDLKMKTIDGLEVLKQIKIKNTEIKVIVISSHYQDNSIGFMVKEGVAAFLPKGISPFELIEIIKDVDETGFYFNKNQIEILREQISMKAPKPEIESDEHLSDREKEIIELFCKQKTAKEIGDILFITQRTVEGHKNNIFAKIKVKNVAGLIIYALQKGIVSLEDLSLE